MINYLDGLRRRVSYRTAKALAKTSITPNQITLVRFIVAAPARAYFFSRGDHVANLLGLLIYVPLAIVDWVDGDLARLTNQVSALGKFLDDTLDRVLMLLVLGSLFYAGINSPNSLWWGLMAILFFAAHFFLTVLLVNFDHLFGLEFAEYPQIEVQLSKFSAVSIADRVLLNFLNVHRNSLSKFLFCISYPLFVGIIINQLLLAFVFITLMLLIRSAGIIIIMYRVLMGRDVGSALTKVLREYLVQNA